MVNNNRLSQQQRRQPSRAQTGRRRSLLILSFTIISSSFILIWQHVKLVQSIDGGGEYAAFVNTGDAIDDIDGSDTGYLQSLEQGMQQAVDVVKMVGLWPGENAMYPYYAMYVVLCSSLSTNNYNYLRSIIG